VNEDIRINVKFFDNAKTKKLLRVVGTDGILALIRLWMYAAQQRPDGILTNLTPNQISVDAAEFPGDSRKFFNALRDGKWIEKHGRAWKIHDWHEHNSWAADAPQRKLKAKQNAHKSRHKEDKRPETCQFCREETAASSSASSSATSSAPSRSSAPSPSPSPAHNAHRAREAAAAWNELSPFLNRPPVDEAAILAIAEKAERVTDEILKLRADFSWPECINRIKPNSWLVRESRAFSFEWLFGRDRNNTQWNAVKVWDGRLGSSEGDDDNEPRTENGVLKKMVL
jgi:hypothetical protein